MANDLTAALTGVRARYLDIAHGPAYTEDIRASADDVPLLLAAIDAALNLADDASLMSIDAAGAACAWDLDPAMIREAITRELAKGETP